MKDLNLPKQCGVMLLTDCTVFPYGGLPLYIFEQRYRIMLEQALESDSIFAVARQLEGDNSSEPMISPVGTAGLIRASSKRGDGTSGLLLQGLARVRFTKWLHHQPYPCAMIEPEVSVPMEPAQDSAAMKILKDIVADCLIKLPQKIKRDIMTILDQAREAGQMSDIVAQQLVRDPNLRQKLLETPATGKRVSLLCNYLSDFDLTS